MNFRTRPCVAAPGADSFEKPLPSPPFPPGLSAVQQKAFQALAADMDRLEKEHKTLQLQEQNFEKRKLQREELEKKRLQAEIDGVSLAETQTAGGVRARETPSINTPQTSPPRPAIPAQTSPPRPAIPAQTSPPRSAIPPPTRLLRLASRFPRLPPPPYSHTSHTADFSSPSNATSQEHPPGLLSAVQQIAPSKERTHSPTTTWTAGALQHV